MYQSGYLTALLPHQPPAGKLIYKISLSKNDNTIPLNDGHPVIIRFKGDVPIFIIIPHVILIFMAMLIFHKNRT
jgi:hypothetical protein